MNKALEISNMVNYELNEMRRVDCSQVRAQLEVVQE